MNLLIIWFCSQLVLEKIYQKDRLETLTLIETSTQYNPLTFNISTVEKSKLKCELRHSKFLLSYRQENSKFSIEYYLFNFMAKE